MRAIARCEHKLYLHTIVDASVECRNEAFIVGIKFDYPYLRPRVYYYLSIRGTDLPMRDR